MEVDKLRAAARLAMMLGRVERATLHPDGITPESDTDHTVMLSLLVILLVPAVNARRIPETHLRMGLALQFAAVHDLVEAYAGDTVTLGEHDRAEKAAREKRALGIIRLDLPELAEIIDAYDLRDTDEARFVHYLDKLCPKLTHAENGGLSLERLGFTPDNADMQHLRQAEELVVENPDLPQLHRLLKAAQVDAMKAYRARLEVLNRHDVDPARVVWGLLHNLERYVTARKPRWAHVCDATGLSSSAARRLCVEYEFDADEIIGPEEEGGAEDDASGISLVLFEAAPKRPVDPSLSWCRYMLGGLDAPGCAAPTSGPWSTRSSRSQVQIHPGVPISWGDLAEKINDEGLMEAIGRLQVGETHPISRVAFVQRLPDSEVLWDADPDDNDKLVAVRGLLHSPAAPLTAPLTVGWIKPRFGRWAASFGSYSPDWQFSEAYLAKAWVEASHTAGVAQPEAAR